MARIRAEEVNRPRAVRAYGLTPGIGGAHALGWIPALRTKLSLKAVGERMVSYHGIPVAPAE